MLYIFKRYDPYTVSNPATKFYKAASTGLFVIVFLWLFDNGEQNSILLFVDNGIVVFAAQMFALFIFHGLFAQNYFSSGVRLWQYAAGVAITVFLGFTLMYCYVTPVYFNTAYSLTGFAGYIQQNLSFLFPFVLFLVAVDYIFLLNNRLRRQVLQLQIMPAEINTANGDCAVQNDFIMHNEAGSAIFRTSKSNILYIKSADNYIQIHYLSGNVVEKELFRYPLSAVETDIENKFLYRVHRSYLCNLQNVTSISGGTQNCCLHFMFDDRNSIPVARGRAKDTMQILHNLQSKN